MGEEDLNGRADQYALAATAYHLLTGSHLFPHSNPAVVIGRHLTATPPTLADSNAELSYLDPILAVAMAKEPNDRFRRCSDFAEALSGETRREQSVSPIAATTPASTAAAPTPRSSRPAPTKHPTKNGSTWRVAAVYSAAAAILTVVIVLGFQLWDNRSPVASTATSAPPSAEPLPTPSRVTSLPSPPPPHVFPASAIDTVLLTPAEINTLIGGPGDPLMKVGQTTHGMLNNENLVTPPSCVGVIFTGERAVFAETGYTAMLTEQLEQSASPYYYNLVGPLQVAQTVAIYDTADQADSVLTASRRQWQSCATSDVRLGTVGQNGENNLNFQLGEIRVTGNSLSVPMVANSQENGGSACQQVMAVRANVVTVVRACRNPEPPPGEYVADISSVRADATPLANAMIDKITV